MARTYQVLTLRETAALHRETCFCLLLGSPFICQVIDSRQVKVSGEGLEKTAVNRQASFYIDVQGQPSTIEVRVLSPTRRTVPSAIEPLSETRYSVAYTPVEVGKSASRRLSFN